MGPQGWSSGPGWWIVEGAAVEWKRGIIKRVDPKDSSRFEVEIRMERGRGEIKSIKGENIMAVPAAQARFWTTEENQWQEDKRKREREERKWKEVQDQRDRQ